MKQLTKTLVLLVTLGLWSGSILADPVWIDVRSIEEYAEDHIQGDTNIPIDTINPELLASEYGKEAEINLYCRSGNRAGRAMALLQDAGFTNVKNVGGIDDVRDLRDLVRSSDAR